MTRENRLPATGRLKKRNINREARPIQEESLKKREEKSAFEEIATV